ncbi:hypothetical protein ABZX92_43255 [Lentzea sp. NPDC006480]
MGNSEKKTADNTEAVELREEELDVSGGGGGGAHNPPHSPKK